MNDTEHSALVTDHPFIPHTDDNNVLCIRCSLGIAAHAKVLPREEVITWYAEQRRLGLNPDRPIDHSGDSDRLQALAQERLTPDFINHPPHYTQHPSGVECIDVVEHMNFNRGNAVKYIWRAGAKGDELEDLKKARWYLEREILNMEGRA